MDDERSLERGSKILGSNLRAEVRVIHPEEARTLLRSQHDNRTVKRGAVDRWAHTMSRGAWVVAEPLMFDAQGRLFDGQHRLEAVIKSDCPISFLCIYGYEPASVFAVVGAGAKRSVADWLSIRNEPSPSVLASLLRLVSNDLAGVRPSNSGTSAALMDELEIVGTLDAHPELRDIVTDAPGTINSCLPRALACFLYWKFQRISEPDARQFFIDLTTQSDQLMRDLRNLLRRRWSDRKQRRLTQGDLIFLAYTTWNIRRTGEGELLEPESKQALPKLL